jgi:hemolysin-activating ACP:hemolysin acyltransferase
MFGFLRGLPTSDSLVEPRHRHLLVDPWIIRILPAVALNNVQLTITIPPVMILFIA